MKKRQIESVLRRIYEDVTETEISCLIKIYSSGEATTQGLAKLLKRDVSHIARCLKNLYSRGLITREAKCCTHGKRGRYWVYKPLPKSRFKKVLRGKTNKLCREILKNIRKI